MTPMSQENLAKLSCENCRKVNYHTTKNKKIKVRLELRKYCKHCKAVKMHKETK